MFIPVNVEYNRNNLKYIANFLKKKEISYFIFFGTLLGITRDNDIIKNDDDVDIYINIKDREKLISVITQTDFLIDYSLIQNQFKYFLQLSKIYNKNINTYVELYFYEETKNHIIDRWNFRGIGNKKSADIIIPKNILFPTKEIDFNGTLISVPKDEEGVCKFLYGKNWKKPMIKRKDYRTVIFFGRPFQLTGFFGSLMYQIEYKFRNFLKN
tara:strand:- start:852 stop:1487 length:636 start_codon:yes stop_codon:yes gene_type:complete